MITQSEHGALTWAVDVAEHVINVKEAAYSFMGRRTEDARQRARIYEARRFLVREAPTKEEVRS